MHLSWVVVGAGPHGLAVASALTEHGGAADVAVVDPHPQPLARWSARAQAIGMTAMRSPWVHHCGRRPEALSDYAARRGVSSQPTGTPPLSVFEGHARERFAGCGVTRVVAEAVALRRCDRGWQVGLDDGRLLRARRVIAATGMDAHRAVLAGTRAVPDQPVEVHAGRVAVIGAGHTGASAALRVVELGGRVDLFAARGLRARSTDVEAGWFGPKYLRSFGLADAATRAQRVRDARTGTTTPQTAGRLRALRKPGLVRLYAVRVRRCVRDDARAWLLTDDGRHGPYEQVYDATGYRVDLANVPLLAGLGLPTCAGLPVLDRWLQAREGLHVVGALAELELGPAGRNLWGAQRAVERIETGRVV